jgi:hypothetical protein
MLPRSFKNPAGGKFIIVLVAGKAAAKEKSKVGHLILPLSVFVKPLSLKKRNRLGSINSGHGSKPSSARTFRASSLMSNVRPVFAN